MIFYNNDMSSGLFLKFMYSISVSKFGVKYTFYTPSVGFCENIGQSDNSKDALIGSKFECLPWDCSLLMFWVFIVNPDNTSSICKIIAISYNHYCPNEFT